MRFLAVLVAVVVLAGACSESARPSGTSDASLAGGVTVTEFVGERPDALRALFDNDPDGAVVAFDTCHTGGNGEWRFTGNIELPDGVAEATFLVTVGWPLFADEGSGADVQRLVEVVGGGEFAVAFSAQDTNQSREATTAPTGSVYDPVCLLGITQGTIGVVERSHRAGPTSSEVPGPRVVVNGRLLPGAEEPDPPVPDLVGWLTGLTPEPGFTSDPERGDAGSSTWGPATLELDGEEYYLPAGTPSRESSCGMVVVFNEFGGGGATATSCFVAVGLGAGNTIDWIAMFSGPEFDRDPETGWDAALDPGDSVEIVGVSQVKADRVIIEGELHLSLPLADSVAVDCGDLQTGDLEVVPGHLRGFATVDIDHMEVTSLACESLYGG